MHIKGNQVAMLDYSEAVNSVAFSPDGEHIITASPDKTARIWESRPR